MYIYIIKNIKNYKNYIGQRTKCSYNDTKYMGSGILIKRAIKKYGIENFEKEILQECNSQEELNEAEKYWIKHFNSLSPNGYNISEGGHFGNMGEIVNKKISEKKKKWWLELNLIQKKQICNKISKSQIGKNLTINHKTKISNTLLNKPKTPEHIEKMRFNRIKFKGMNYQEMYGTEKSIKIKEKISKKMSIVLLGRKVSDETRKKMSLAKIGKLPWNYNTATKINKDELILEIKKNKNLDKIALKLNTSVKIIRNNIKFYDIDYKKMKLWDL